jgi:hypothetical protein
MSHDHAHGHDHPHRHAEQAHAPAPVARRALDDRVPASVLMSGALPRLAAALAALVLLWAAVAWALADLTT